MSLSSFVPTCVTFTQRSPVHADPIHGRLPQRSVRLLIERATPYCGTARKPRWLARKMMVLAPMRRQRAAFHDMVYVEL